MGKNCRILRFPFNELLTKRQYGVSMIHGSATTDRIETAEFLLRGMIGDVARQLLRAVTMATGRDADGSSAAEADALCVVLVRKPAILSHIHALALEWQATKRLRLRLSLDPVRSSLLQARFCQSQRRVKVTLGKLPSALLHDAPMALRAAGLKQQAVEEQMFALHPQAAIPGGMGRLGANRAAAILVLSRDFTGN